MGALAQSPPAEHQPGATGNILTPTGGGQGPGVIQPSNNCSNYLGIIKDLQFCNAVRKNMQQRQARPCWWGSSATAYDKIK